MVMAASAGAPREKSIYYSTVGVVEVPSVLDRWHDDEDDPGHQSGCGGHKILRELTAVQTPATSLPFLDLEPGHRCEVPHIVRYNGRFHRHGMRGDHEIEITDRLACALERRADARIVESHRWALGSEGEAVFMPGHHQHDAIQNGQGSKAKRKDMQQLVALVRNQ